MILTNTTGMSQLTVILSTFRQSLQLEPIETHHQEVQPMYTTIGTY